MMESQQQCNVTHIASAHRHPDGQGEQLPALGVPLLLHSSRQQPVLQAGMAAPNKVPNLGYNLCIYHTVGQGFPP